MQSPRLKYKEIIFTPQQILLHSTYWAILLKKSKMSICTMEGQISLGVNLGDHSLLSACRKFRSWVHRGSFGLRLGEFCLHSTQMPQSCFCHEVAHILMAYELKILSFFSWVLKILMDKDCMSDFWWKLKPLLFISHPKQEKPVLFQRQKNILSVEFRSIFQ